MEIAATTTSGIMGGVSPMMAQWHSCKKVAKQAVLLFRMGDFYEAFYDDAVLIARELELTLTQRQGIPMAGVPFHSSDGYIDRLVGKGHRVAIAEQMEDPKAAKGLVRREVVRTITPGSVISSSLLVEKVNNYFAAVTQVGAIFGCAFLDITTSEFLVVECEDLRELINEVCRLQPKEFLTSERFHDKQRLFFDDIRLSYPCFVSTQEDWRFDHHTACSFLLQHFGVHSLDGFGLKGKVAAINAAGALLAYLKDDLSLSIDHVQVIKSYTTADYLVIDRTTQQNLELIQPLREASRQSTLLSVLDKTKTPMGGRLLRQWTQQPLLSPREISLRQDAIESLLLDPGLISTLQENLEGVRDLERLIMRVETGYAMPRDLVALRGSLEHVPAVKGAMQPLSPELLREQAAALVDLSMLTRQLSIALEDSPPLRITEGQIFREGYHSGLDELRAISRDGKSWIAHYQTTVREETGIKTLKVGYTKVFGYYIEVSKGQCDKMPDTFHRRQTLTNCERFISPALKEYENTVLHAEERMISLEQTLFEELRLHVATYREAIMGIARAIAHIDVLCSLALAARQHNYVRPVVDESTVLEIIDGRHPVIEAAQVGTTFIPNDTLLDADQNRLFIITGPNMAGKSTYIRQVALIVIMAQMGSFIPAKEARIGVIDKVFSRIGASDDLSRGQSTFMVEMTETANILHNATSRSLVILDEIGRGTSTYDGISIAWAVAEYLLKMPGKQAKTLFATHYWELTRLEGLIPGAVNYNVGVKEWNDKIIFLHKILKGGTDRSYGIHVAQLAGMPKEALDRAKEILIELEDGGKTPVKGRGAASSRRAQPEMVEMTLFDLPPRLPRAAEAVLQALRHMPLDETTPKEALEKLFQLQRQLQH